MNKKRQWLVGRILHITAQLADTPDELSKNSLEQALLLYTQALRDLEMSSNEPPYFS